MSRQGRAGGCRGADDPCGGRLDLGASGVKLVGACRKACRPLPCPHRPWLIAQLWVPALLISVIGFVESVSVAQTLAAKRRQRIAPDQELIGTGRGNIASAFRAAIR
jgi:sulfate permease, SulP family